MKDYSYLRGILVSDIVHNTKSMRDFVDRDLDFRPEAAPPAIFDIFVRFDLDNFTKDAQTRWENLSELPPGITKKHPIDQLFVLETIFPDVSSKWITNALEENGYYSA